MEAFYTHETFKATSLIIAVPYRIKCSTQAKAKAWRPVLLVQTKFNREWLKW